MAKKAPLYEKIVASWLKHDPFVSLVIKNDDRYRRDVMLNLLGTKAAARHFGKFPPKKADEGPIYPSTVREEVDRNLHQTSNRTNLIKKLVFWASNAQVNNRYEKSHLTRIQVVQSLLGPVFFHATHKQEDLILKGLKHMLVKKITVTGLKGEQAPQVHEVLLERIAEMLIHNQKVIINKAVTEAEEKMRVHLLRQIQELRGTKHSAQFHDVDGRAKIRRIVKEKFPLQPKTAQHLEEMLTFYAQQTKWTDIQDRAKEATQKIEQIRKPLTLTSQESTG